jgi:prepilin-type N-terminal cleavage/methylation domain-containing protein
MNNKTPHPSPKGFTLIELLVYLTLVSGILVTATTFAWNIINSRTKAFAIQEVEQNGRLMMDRIVQEIHQAQKVEAPAIGDKSDSLSLNMRAASEDPVVFSLYNARLYVSHGAAAPVALSTDDVMVTSLVFRNIGTADGTTSSVEVELVLEHRNPDRRQEWQADETFTTAVTLRDTY